MNVTNFKTATEIKIRRLQVKAIIEFLFPTTFNAIKGMGYQEAVKDILVFKDKIYTGNITLPGDQEEVVNCTFLGNEAGLKIEP